MGRPCLPIRGPGCPRRRFGYFFAVEKVPRAGARNAPSEMEILPLTRERPFPATGKERAHAPAGGKEVSFMAKKEEKTNVMRILDQKKIPYTALTYPH